MTMTERSAELAAQVRGLVRGGPVTTRALAMACGCSLPTIRRVLETMEQDGELSREGRQPARWCLRG